MDWSFSTFHFEKTKQGIRLKILFYFTAILLLCSCNPLGKGNVVSDNVVIDSTLNGNGGNGNGGNGNGGNGSGNSNGGGNGGPPLDEGGKIGFSPPVSTNCEDYRTKYNLDDPYFCNQWHLSNRGQKVEKVPDASTYTGNATAGVDIHSDYSLKNYSGKGVKFYITDDGLQFSHPDIKDNYIGGFNNCTGEANSLPKSSSNNHGTMVSGIIAAKGNNGIGVSGVSHEAEIFVNNYISCQIGTSSFISAIKVSKNYNIWSGSFGMPACNVGLIPRSQQQTIYDAYTFGAKDNNILYFKANGNDNKCGAIGNNDPANTHYAVASIAAMDFNGKITTYSSRGPNLLASGFGGYGGSSPNPGIVTISGTSTYTSSMNGTSAATPIVAGTAGLLLEAAPGYSWYDYQAILARGATIIEEPKTVSSTIAGIDDVNYLVNDAGYRHSFTYGFGAVDADASLSLALTKYSTLPALKKFSDEFSKIPQTDTNSSSFNGASCAEKTVKIADDFQIFSGEFSFDVQMTNVSNLSIFVTTPNGNKAQIVRPNGMPGSNLIYDQYFKTFQFFAMTTKGDWKVSVCGNGSGTFKGAKLNFFGFSGAPIPKRKI